MKILGRGPEWHVTFLKMKTIDELKLLDLDFDIDERYFGDSSNQGT